MPTETVHLTRVYPPQAGNGRYELYAPARMWWTFNAWQAAFAERAVRRGQAVTIGSQDTKYGLKLVTIALAEGGTDVSA